MATEIANIPHKVDTEVATYDADQWTEEQVRNGEATPSRVQVSTTWYEPGPDGTPVKVINPARIAELETQIKEH